MLSITPFLWFAPRPNRPCSSTRPSSRDQGDLGPPGRRHRIGDLGAGGQQFIGLNAGPHYTFNEAVSFFFFFETQQEVDELWDKLLASGGKPTQCGWLKDRFGLSWQIIPNVLPKLLGDPDRAKAGRALQAMMQMVKIDGPALQRAFDGA